jgi:hypothetical protein
MMACIVNGVKELDVTTKTQKRVGQLEKQGTGASSSSCTNSWYVIPLVISISRNTYASLQKKKKKVVPGVVCVL